LPKGTFIVTKTGFRPIQVKLKLFFEWGITFEKIPYEIPIFDRSNIRYTNRERIETAIRKKYPSITVRQKEPGEAHTVKPIYIEPVEGKINQMKTRESQRRIYAERTHRDDIPQ
jgi:hypothetical protein